MPYLVHCCPVTSPVHRTHSTGECFILGYHAALFAFCNIIGVGCGVCGERGVMGRNKRLEIERSRVQFRILILSRTRKRRFRTQRPTVKLYPIRFLGNVIPPRKTAKKKVRYCSSCHLQRRFFHWFSLPILIASMMHLILLLSGLPSFHE